MADTAQIAEEDSLTKAMATLTKAALYNRLRVVQHDVFHFMALDAPCPHWTGGMHIVNRDGTCKCGRVFTLTVEAP